MFSKWSHLSPWTDWIAALAVAVVVFNLNVTSAGDPLSGLGLPTDPTAAGISEAGRHAFYSVLAVGGFLLAAAGLVALLSDQRANQPAALVARTFAGVALAGLLGLLLDYRDGPVRTVHLGAYLMLALGAVRLVRVLAMLGARSDRGGAQVGSEGSTGQPTEAAH